MPIPAFDPEDRSLGLEVDLDVVELVEVVEGLVPVVADEGKVSVEEEAEAVIVMVETQFTTSSTVMPAEVHRPSANVIVVFRSAVSHTAATQQAISLMKLELLQMHLMSRLLHGPI
jgi:hypothetical protein